jgi:hypothetical protein
MAAINFPAAPADGQLFTAAGVIYQWSAAKGLWLAPTTPVSGPVAASLYDKLTTWQSAQGGGYDIATVMQITQGAQVPWPGGAIKSFTAVDPSRPIEVDCTLLHGAGGVALSISSGLFIDGGANAVQQSLFTANAQWMGPTRIHWRGALSAGAHTFQVRWGAQSGSYLMRNDGTVLGSAHACTIAIREVAN